MTTNVPELATSCVEYIKRSLGLELDYTQETLPLLDHYLREARTTRGNATRAGAGLESLLDPLLGPLLPTSGAYFAELVMRVFPGARLHAPDEDYAHYRLEFAPFFLHFNPMGIAHEVLTQADAPGWNAHFSVLKEARPVVDASLANAMAVREQDYYSFSVRYETLEQVIAVVAALEEQRPGPPRHFSHEVYQGAAGSAVPNKG